MLHTYRWLNTDAVRLLLLAVGLSIVAAMLGEPRVALAAPSEDLRVWRVQIRFVTDGASNMGTDDDVEVSLNDGNHTWVDYGRDDFETGDDFTYDLLLTNIS